MPTAEYCTGAGCGGGPYDVYAVSAPDWDDHYKKHVDALLACSKQKGIPANASDPCKLFKVRSPAAAAGAESVPSRIAGVHLYADINNDGAWDYNVVGSSPFQLGYDPGVPIPITPGTLLTIGWSADRAHPNCFIATTFPAGVTVDGISTGTNWLLSESPQTIGDLTVPGDYYFHIDCDDDDSHLITAESTFQIAGQPPTVLRLQGIVDGMGTLAFDYPSPGQSHVDLLVDPTSDVVMAWTSSNVVAGTCMLREAFEPAGPTPQTFPEESGFESVMLRAFTDQNYRLNCMGEDGSEHSVDMTLNVLDDVHVRDFARFQNCFRGSGAALPGPACADFDSDPPDGDIDVLDFAVFHSASIAH
jgi:hypothetical protein